MSEQRVQLRAGRQTFSYPFEANADGFVRYQAEIVADGDTRAQNNIAAALIDIQGEPRVLLGRRCGGRCRQFSGGDYVAPV